MISFQSELGMAAVACKCMGVVSAYPWPRVEYSTVGGVVWPTYRILRLLPAFFYVMLCLQHLSGVRYIYIYILLN